MSNLKLFWSREPGNFVNAMTGKTFAEIIAGSVSKTLGPQFSVSSAAGPDFTGSVREWYETLVETVINCRNQLAKSINVSSYDTKIYASPDVLTMLEASVLFSPTSKKEKRSSSCFPRAGSIHGMSVVESRQLANKIVRVVVSTIGSSAEGSVEVIDL